MACRFTSSGLSWSVVLGHHAALVTICGLLHSGKARRESVSLAHCCSRPTVTGVMEGEGKREDQRKEAGQESLQARAAPPCSWSPGRALLVDIHGFLLCSPSSPPGRLPSGYNPFDWRQGRRDEASPRTHFQSPLSPPLNTVTPQPNTSFKAATTPRHTGRVCSLLNPLARQGQKSSTGRHSLKVGPAGCTPRSPRKETQDRARAHLEAPSHS